MAQRQWYAQNNNGCYEEVVRQSQMTTYRTAWACCNSQMILMEARLSDDYARIGHCAMWYIAFVNYEGERWTSWIKIIHAEDKGFHPVGRFRDLSSTHEYMFLM